VVELERQAIKCLESKFFRFFNEMVKNEKNNGVRNVYVKALKEMGKDHFP